MKNLKRITLSIVLLVISNTFYSQNNIDIKEEVFLSAFHFLDNTNEIELYAYDAVDGKEVLDTIVPFNYEIIPYPLDSSSFAEKKILLLNGNIKIKELKYTFDLEEAKFNNFSQIFYNCNAEDTKEYKSEKFIYFTIILDKETNFYNLYVLKGTKEEIF
jgi:hypothetical protein